MVEFPPDGNWESRLVMRLPGPRPKRRPMLHPVLNTAVRITLEKAMNSGEFAAR
jgi:hypothetical protein